MEIYRLDPELVERHALARESGRSERKSLDYQEGDSGAHEDRDRPANR